MQTFMPYSSYYLSLRCLDNKRLGKQRVEAKQILDILLVRTDKRGWRNHPVVKMWKGYEDSLKIYYNICLYQWINRDFKNNMPFENLTCNWNKPWWIGLEEFHNSHKSNLLRKDPIFYGKKGWNIKDNLPYIWPTEKFKIKMNY